MNERADLTGNKTSWNCCPTLDSASEKMVPSLTVGSSVSVTRQPPE